jgi:hypothetical protein
LKYPQYEQNRLLSFATITRNQLKAIAAISFNHSLGDSSDELALLMGMIQEVEDLALLQRSGVLTDVTFSEVLEIRDGYRDDVALSTARRFYFLIYCTTGFWRGLINSVRLLWQQNSASFLLTALATVFAVTGVIQVVPVIQGFTPHKAFQVAIELESS